MSDSSDAPRNPYFQLVSHRKEPFGEQVFYWLHWIEEGRMSFVQVILDYAAAKRVTGFFLRAAQVDADPPEPVRLPALDLSASRDTLTVRATGAGGIRTIVFDRRLAAGMSCTLATAGLAIREVGADVAAFPDLGDHPLARSLAASSAQQEMRDHPAFDVLRVHPGLREMAVSLAPV